MLDLTRLQALHAVATYGSVGAAADVLQISPSAVSQQLAKLERETRCPLVERQGRGVRLTDEALVLSEHATRILKQMEEAETDVASRRGAVVGRLAIAAFPTATRGLLVGALRTLAGRYPELTTTLTESDPVDTVPRVTRGEMDLGIVQDWNQDWNNVSLPVPDGLERADLCDDYADLAVPADHPLAAESVPLFELAGADWISPLQGTVCHDWLVHTFRNTGVEPRLRYYAEEYDTQLALVAAGLGVTIIPRLGRSRIPDGVRVLGVHPTVSRRVYAIWRSESSRRPAIRAALDALHTAADGLPQP